jgi:hypothetical protein
VHADLEAAKWIALVSMTIDHYGKIVNPDLFEVTHLLGRVAFPLFAGIIGIRLAISPDLATRYLRSLVPWALLSQPAYVLAGREWGELNILFTLLCGVGVEIGMRSLAARRWAGGAALIALAVVCASFCEFGVGGALMVALVALCARLSPRFSLGMTGPFGVLFNARTTSPYLVATDFAALAATPFALGSLAVARHLPRIPKHLFYAYYPAHLVVLHALDV